MTATQFASAPDGTRIAYDVTESGGPPLVLLHGFSHDRQMWHDLGWTARLQDDFTVITVDLRGCGESDGPLDARAYHHDRVRNDVLTVADTVGAQRFYLWVWSFGATVGLLLAAHPSRVIRAVIAGTVFGPIFTADRVQPQIAHFRAMQERKESGDLDDLPTGDRAWIESTNLRLLIARLEGARTIAGVEPDEVTVPALILTGTGDARVVPRLDARQDDIHTAGLDYRVLAGVDHWGLVAAIDAVAPVVVPFLRGADSD